MTGSNHLSLNQSTLLEAIQMWVAATFKEPTPIAKSVSADLSKKDAPIFMVELAAPEKPVDAPVVIPQAK